MRHENIGGMSDAAFGCRQREAMRAFQHGASWYDAYWYPEHRTPRAAAVSRVRSTLSMIWNSWATPRLSERMAEPVLALK